MEQQAIKRKTETDFMSQELRADSDTLTETFNEDIFHAKDEQEMDTLQHEEEMDESSANLYDPIEFNGVNVPFQIRELFHFITKYRPQILEMETKLKPFLPDFIPAVGDPDAFLKIDRPDESAEFLGLTIIDEPSLNQSDPSVLDLRLRSIYKQSSAKKTVARTIEEGNKVKAIEKWIKDINELHRSKPLPTVNYNKPLPDIDALLQEWNPDVEDILSEDKILPSNLNCDLSFYIDVACVYLRTSPDVALKRIKTRNRVEEAGITRDEIGNIHNKYEAWITSGASGFQFVVIDANNDVNTVQQLIMHHLMEHNIFE
uniref:Intraflagellar transport protein 46 homolog n=1 Tax=Daphnia sinensis TaxID=1820382 RepID=A0A4Y7NBD8_9CRUS|nr:EOG090X0FP3 [Daphnia sinensis]